MYLRKLPWASFQEYMKLQEEGHVFGNDAGIALQLFEITSCLPCN